MLPELRARDFETKVIGKLRKVFTVRRTSTGDVHYTAKDRQTGKLILRTKHSQKRRISPWQAEQIKKQLFLTRQGFFDLMDCPLSAEGYRNLLIEKGKI